MPNAPDGKPPLSFVIDTTTFLGGMTIPATLFLLGAALARLKVRQNTVGMGLTQKTPKRWKKQPLVAIFTMTLVKMVLVPLIGVDRSVGFSERRKAHDRFLVQALRNETTLYPKSDPSESPR